ncbi:hypothetical protein F511_14709 [Dorcoceras hygrometricum]|uniref:CCHC-type domain-containing protein n=1 Tax=Dorcoceras hygrometricum TaxID=472368 RepID=A0A2Z7BM91_9LAMI|nr:hypothetical protein F511_14709 [Dorcoceras hygrometricum]
MKFFNCERPGHFAAECNRPKKDDRYKRDDKRTDDRYKKEDRYNRDDKSDERAVDRSKERSKDRRMTTRGDKRSSRKHDRKVLVAEESTKSWADTDSKYSSSSSSSSDSEQEEVHCLMADQTSDDEVFYLSNVEFTREDLVSALNDMVKEYRKLSHSFEEVKAENSDLKNSSAEPSAVELGEAESLKIELSKLTAENELLREESSELKAEIVTLNELVSSWNKSYRSLHKLQEIQKSVYDRTGLGFNNSKNSEGETSTQSQPAYDKFNKMSFVKANVIYDCCESMIYDDQTSQKLNHNGKAGIGFQKLENSKPSWLKNKLDKDKAKAGRKSFVPNQPWRSSTKVKSGWKNVQPKRDLSGQSMKSKLNRSHSTYAKTLMDSYTGRTVKVIADTAQMGPDAEDHGVGAPDVEDQPAGTTVGEKQCDTDEEMETIGAGTGVGDQQLHSFVTADSRTDAAAYYFVEEPEEVEMSDDEQSVDERIDADEAMSLEDILLSISVDVLLPSAGVDFTKIILGKDIKIPGVDERTWYLATAATPDLAEALAQLRASIEQIRDRVDDAKLKDTILMHLHGIEQRFTARLDDQDRVLGALLKDSHNQKQLLSLDIKSSQKQLSAQAAAAAFDTVDVRRVVKELDAKVTYLDGQVAATRNDLLEFPATAQETLNHIADQLSELIAYINRGGNDKKGEVSSSRPQPPPDDQNRNRGNTGGDNIKLLIYWKDFLVVCTEKVGAEVEAVEDAVLVPRENILVVLVGLSEDLLKTG